MAAEIASLSDEQLVHKVLSTERDFMSARFSHGTGQLENTAQLKVFRRDIARLKTEARRREIEQGLSKDSLVAKYRTGFGTSAEEADGADASAADKGGFLKGIVDKLKGGE